MRRFIDVKAALAWAFAGFGVLTLVAALVIGLALQASATGKINAERARNVRLACEAQNKRHDDTVTALDKLIAKAPAEKRVRAKAGRDSTLLLIDALAPERDCKALVKSAVRSTS